MTRILMMNQVSGPLFRELAEDLSVEFGSADLLSGHLDDLARKPCKSLNLIKGPDYKRNNLFTRSSSWLKFLFFCLSYTLRSDRDSFLLIVSNPPFLGLVGWFFSILRRQKYCILVYDIYPGVLVQLGHLSRNGFIASLWRFFNRLVWERAELIFTIGDYMANNIRSEGGARCNISVIPVWVDVDFIQPIDKKNNSFVQSLAWQDRLIVLYSGNLGDTHDLDSLLEVARDFRDRDDIGFLFIGSGSKWPALKEFVQRHKLQNVKLFPFQPEHRLPLTLPAGDLSVVSLDPLVSGYLIPSKSYYYLAAGSALLAIMQPPNEISDIVEQGRCGFRVDPGDSLTLKNLLISILKDEDKLSVYRSRARAYAVSEHSRTNTIKFAAALRPFLSNDGK